MRPALLLLLTVAVLAAEDRASKPAAEDIGRIANTWRIELSDGQDLLAAVERVIAEHKINDGIVLTGVGNVASCRYHSIDGKIVDVAERTALISLAGPVTKSKPHLHVSVAPQNGPVGAGHLERGCKAGSHVEILVAAFAR